MRSQHKRPTIHDGEHSVLRNVVAAAAVGAIAVTVSSCGFRNPFDKPGETVGKGEQVEVLAKTIGKNILLSSKRAGSARGWTQAYVPERGKDISLTRTLRAFDPKSRSLVENQVTAIFGHGATPRDPRIHEIKFESGIDKSPNDKVWNPDTSKSVYLGQIDGGWTLTDENNRNWGDIPAKDLKFVSDMAKLAINPAPGS